MIFVVSSACIPLPINPLASLRSVGYFALMLRPMSLGYISAVISIALPFTSSNLSYSYLVAPAGFFDVLSPSTRTDISLFLPVLGSTSGTKINAFCPLNSPSCGPLAICAAIMVLIGNPSWDNPLIPFVPI